MPGGRQNVFLKAVLGTAGAQVISTIVGLVSVPIGLRYFGAARYGIWMLVTTLIVYLSASQFGIGQATAVFIAKSDSATEQQRILGRAFRLLLLVSLALGPVIAAGYFYPQTWLPALGAIPDALIQEAVYTVLVTATLFLVRSPLVVFPSAFIGIEQVHWERFYSTTLPALSGLGALLATVWLHGGLVMLAFLTGAGQCLAALLSVAHFRLQQAGRHQAAGMPGQEIGYKAILASGRGFLVIGLAAMIVLNTDNIVISHFLGPASVASYSVTFRLFSTIFSGFIMINTALWPMYGRAFARADWDWLGRTYRITTQVLPVAGGLVWVGGAAFARDVIHIWAGSAGYAGMLTVMALGGYGYALSLVNCHSTCLSALNHTQNMVRAAVMEAAVNLALSLLLVQPLGVGGVALGTALASVLTVFWLLPRHITQQTAGQLVMQWRPVARHLMLAVLPAVLLVYVVDVFVQGWEGIIFKVVLVMGYLLASLLLIPGVTRLATWQLVMSVLGRRQEAPVTR